MESGFSQLDSAIVAQRIELAEKTSGGLTIPPPSPEVFGVVDPADAEWLRRRLTPLPLDIGADPAGTSSGKWSQQDLHCLHEPGLPASRSNT